MAAIGRRRQARLVGAAIRPMFELMPNIARAEPRPAAA
jgi:hypothetical protein